MKMTADMELMEAGLLGPVRIVPAVLRELAGCYSNARSS
jgi:hypothetical protein